jgi:hypothetical protein
MWYRVDLLFAQPPIQSGESVLCESCNVLFEAQSADEAYEKGLSWAENNVQQNPAFHFVGIENIFALDETQPGEGSEVGGIFFEENVWERLNEFIPQRSTLNANFLEANKNMPLNEILTQKQKNILHKAFDVHEE